MPTNYPQNIYQFKVLDAKLCQVFDDCSLTYDALYDELKTSMNNFFTAGYIVTPHLAAKINNFFISHYVAADKLDDARDLVRDLDLIIKIGVTPTSELHQKLENLMLVNMEAMNSDDITNILWIAAKSGNSYSKNFIQFLDSNFLNNQHKPKNFYEKVNALWSLSINKFMERPSCKNALINNISKMITTEEIHDNSFSKEGTYLLHKLLIADLILGNENRIPSHVKFDDEANTSYFQEFVFNELCPIESKYGSLLKKEYFIPALGKRVDGIIIKKTDNLRGSVVIEVDGPVHYTNGPNGDPVLRPSDLFLRKLMEEKLGCTVVSISIYDTYETHWKRYFTKLIDNLYKSGTGKVTAESPEPEVEIAEEIKFEEPEDRKEEAPLSIKEQLYNAAKSNNYSDCIPSDIENILYNANTNANVLNETLLIAHQRNNIKAKLALLSWGAEESYLYSLECNGLELQDNLNNAIAKNNYSLLNHLLHSQSIDDDVLSAALYSALRAQNKEMTMALYDGGARFYDFGSATLKGIFESDDENIKKFTINILEEIILHSNRILSLSSDISGLDFSNISLLDPLFISWFDTMHVMSCVSRYNNTHNDFTKYRIAWEFCFCRLYNTNKTYTLIEVFSDIYDNLGNRKGMIPEVLDFMVFLTFKHFRNMQDSINDENFIKTLNFRKVESLYKAIFKIGEGKFHFTFDSMAKILKQISDEPAFREKGEELVNLLCCCTKFENLNLEVISDLLAHLSREKNIGSVTSIIKHLGLENVDCAKILMRMIEPLDGKANKLLQDGIIGFYVFISALGKNHSDLMNGLEYEKGIRESVKRKGKLIFSGNRTLFSETDLMSAIVDKKITVIEEAVKNKKLEHSLFILNLEGVDEFVRKMCECCKAPSKKPSKKIQDALSYTIPNLIAEIETKDQHSKLEAEEIYKNAFKLAIETGFYDAAKLLAPSCDNAAEFLHILEEYPEHTANMLKECSFKFGKTDLLLYLLSKSFDKNALSDAKSIVEYGYNITDFTIRAVENKCSKMPENNDILEFSQFIKQYFAEHHDIEPQNPHADIIGEETKGGDETPS